MSNPKPAVCLQVVVLAEEDSQVVVLAEEDSQVVVLAENHNPLVEIVQCVPMPPAMARILAFRKTAGSLSCPMLGNDVTAKEA